MVKSQDLIIFVPWLSVLLLTNLFRLGEFVPPCHHLHVQQLQ